MNTEEVVLILGEVFPDLHQTTVSELEHTGEWWKYEVSGKYIFRFPKFDAVAQQLRVEYNLLRFLQDRLPVLTPNPQFFSENPRGGPSPFLGYERIQGTSLDTVDDLHQDERIEIANQLGAFLRVLHSIPVAEVEVACGLVPGGHGDLEDLEGKLDLIVEHLPHDIAEGCEKVLSDMSLKPQASEACALVHRDVHFGNVLVGHPRTAVRAVIDWNDAAIRDPAWDFVDLYAGGSDQPFWHKLIMAYGERNPRSLEERVRYFAFASNISGRAREVPHGWHREDAPMQRRQIWDWSMKELRWLIPRMLATQEG